jgi:hypothetical protein
MTMKHQTSLTRSGVILITTEMIMSDLPLGPYNDKLNGFFFVITPAGVQMEGTVTGGGSSDDSFSTFWDNKWYSKVVRYDRINGLPKWRFHSKASGIKVTSGNGISLWIVGS